LEKPLLLMQGGFFSLYVVDGYGRVAHADAIHASVKPRSDRLLADVYLTEVLTSALLRNPPDAVFGIYPHANVIAQSKDGLLGDSFLPPSALAV
jgi:hypothetical protein